MAGATHDYPQVAHHVTKRGKATLFGLLPHPREVGQERINVRRLLDNLAGRLAAAVPGPGFDADQVRLIADIPRRLQRGNIFEAVARHDAIVMSAVVASTAG